MGAGSFPISIPCDRIRPAAGLLSILVMIGSVSPVPSAHADNQRLNEAVLSGVYTAQHQVGCTNDVIPNNALLLASQWHADDMIGNRSINDDIGSDGSTPQDRANAAGFRGRVTETVAINAALAMSSLEVMNQWYGDPASLAIMRDCANTTMGVWSVNSLNRTVVVALYGQPDAARR